MTSGLVHAASASSGVVCACAQLEPDWFMEICKHERGLCRNEHRDEKSPSLISLELEGGISSEDVGRDKGGDKGELGFVLNQVRNTRRAMRKTLNLELSTFNLENKGTTLERKNKDTGYILTMNLASSNFRTSP